MPFAQLSPILWDSTWPSLFREASLLPSLVQVLPSPMLLSFIWHKILRLFVSVSSRAPHGIANAWHLADTQQVLLDWIHSGKLRANAEAAPCHPGEGSRKYREELLEDGSLVSFSAGRAAEWWSECLLCGACSGSGLVLLNGSCTGCQGWPLIWNVPSNQTSMFEDCSHHWSVVLASTADMAFTTRWH